MVRALPGLVREAAWIGAHLVAYPLGALPGSVERTRRRRGNASAAGQRGLVRHDPGAATTPILLVHGIVDNHSIFTRLDATLRGRGFATVAAHDYGLLTADVAEAATALGTRVRALATATGHDRVHVVGHSLGGLIARWFVQRQGGDDVVDTLVTLGTPHGGTELARLSPLVPLLPMTRALTPGSAVVRALAEPAPGCRTRFVAYASDIDHLVLPHRNARLEHPDLDVTNVDVHGVGHLSMPHHRPLAYEVADLLANGREHVGGESVTKTAEGPVRA
ncbi:esterase/lipase family protein [Microlunatus antarcticus]|uniref:Pimeloyl-ACP methyl ester carboxylesterase n=1 Tax=Microlunatus antarcticus TaxID=53388 RepID=A0A7W5P5N2_9ACTN|nr:alpha/beta fold hydrolase [Microlunatus antarcticus]MBB3325624.1 pimeloyl-ACP methyl ester carboxylesterase [Microlunatus antarcticus]